ncbi:hypothetical protein RF11_09635 [Thelohanellus kitauei]|uniref:Uncharacterized protein n=1 Tax=Thelohanellus kitauei TaxID=669202 RepID=A0A0C2NI96_THEKT|nr:hypothetical protein RF11_09635 [Thelohanellus kitauei]
MPVRKLDREFCDATGCFNADSAMDKLRQRYYVRPDLRFPEMNKYDMCYSYFMDSKACEAKHGPDAQVCSWYLFRRSLCPTIILERFERQYQRAKEATARKKLDIEKMYEAWNRTD